MRLLHNVNPDKKKNQASRHKGHIIVLDNVRRYEYELRFIGLYFW